MNSETTPFAKTRGSCRATTCYAKRNRSSGEMMERFAADIATDFSRDATQVKIWRQQARQIKESVNKCLWSEKGRAYLDSYEGTKVSQQPQVYALTYGVRDESRKADMVSLVMQRGKASEQSFAFWTVNSMFAEGKDQWALDYIRKYWGEQTRLDSFNGAWHEGWNLP